MGARGEKKTGGRKKGSPNKRTVQLSERLEQLGVDVPQRIIDCLRELEALQDDEFTLLEPAQKIAIIKMKFDINAELLPYLHAKRKPVELDDKDAGLGIVYETEWG